MDRIGRLERALFAQAESDERASPVPDLLAGRDDADTSSFRKRLSERSFLII